MAEVRWKGEADEAVCFVLLVAEAAGAACYPPPRRRAAPRRLDLSATCACSRHYDTYLAQVISSC